jgi:hypothetical protein
VSERYLEVVNIYSGEVVHRLDVSGHGDRHVEQIMRGMLINLREGHFIRDTADEDDE